MPPKDPCKRFACKIQDCLEANNFNVDRCKQALDDLKDCCKKFKNVSLVCEGIPITPEEPEKSK